jgi:hypothetical protein
MMNQATEQLKIVAQLERIVSGGAAPPPYAIA